VVLVTGLSSKHCVRQVAKREQTKSSSETKEHPYNEAIHLLLMDHYSLVAVFAWCWPLEYLIYLIWELVGDADGLGQARQHLFQLLFMVCLTWSDVMFGLI